MKVRNGFVSNSSSSSYVVIDRRELRDKDYLVFVKPDGKLIVDGSCGTTEFGWGPETISDAWSRLHFAYLQAVYANKSEWIEMIEDSLKHHCGISEVEWLISPSAHWSASGRDKDGICYAYIDHQSCAYEGGNTEMFDSHGNLESFIFGENSTINLDNDNH